MHSSTHPTSDFLQGGGEMGRLIRAYDWTGTSIGPIPEWPQSLRTTVSIMLRSPVPMVLLWGRDGVMIYNDSYTTFAAGRHPRLLGSPVLQGWPEVAEFNAKVMWVGLSGGTLSYRDQELTLYRSGVPEQVWMNLDYSPVLDESGQPGGVLAIVVETTERVLAERRISDEGERLRQMFRQAPGFMALLRSPEHIFEIVNASYLQLVGHRGDIVGKPAREALPEIEGQGFFELLDQVFSTGEPFVGRDLPVSLQRQPGSPVEQRFIDLVYQPITDKEGQVTGIFVEGYDVTERVQGETALRESQRRFQTIAEAMPGFAWTADEDGLLDFVSRRWTEYSGASQEQSCGENWLNFVHPDDLQRSLEVWSSAIRSQTPYETEFRLRGKDGTYRWWLARALPVRDEVGSGEQGKAVRWVGTCTTSTNGSSPRNASGLFPGS
jgi:PAS domain S-box-containing protein